MRVKKGAGHYFATILLWCVPFAEAQTRESISGVVTDMNGAAISGVRLALRSPQRSLVHHSRTDGNGRFSFTPVTPGSYEIIVSHSGFTDHHAALEIRDEDSVFLEIQLEIKPVQSHVTVTARRGVVEDTAQVARPVNIIEEAEIQDRAKAVVAQVASEEAGVHLQRTSPSLAGIYVRGLTGNKVNVYLDGVRYSTAAARGGINTFLNMIDASSLEAVEILRGPSSAEYGSGALGGSLQFLSKVPHTSIIGKPLVTGTLDQFFNTADTSFGSSVTASYAAPRFGLLLHGVGRRVNPLRPGRGFDSHSAVTRFLGLSSREIVGSRLPETGFSQYGGMLKLSWAPESDLRVTAHYSRAQQDGAKRYDQLLGGDGNLRADLQNLMLDFAYLKLEKFRSGWFDHVSLTYSFSSQREERINQGGNGNPLAVIIHEYEKLRGHGLQAHAAKRWLARQQIRIGGEYHHERIRSPAFGFDPVTRSIDPRRPRVPDRARYDSGGFYLENVFEAVPDRLRLAGSVRYSLASYRARSEDAPIVRGSRLWPSDSLRVSDATYELSLVARARGGFSFTAGVSRGFRAPQMTDLGTLGLTGAGFEVAASDVAALGATVGSSSGPDAASTGIPVEQVRPETSVSFETGLMYRSRRIRADLTFFRNNLQDAIAKHALILPAGAVGLQIGGSRVISQGPRGAVFVAEATNPVLVRSNLSRASISGIEHFLQYAVARDWMLQTAFTYLHARDRESGLPPSIEGGTPAPDAHLKLRYRPAGKSFSIEPYIRAVARNKRLSSLDLQDRRTGATRTRNSIRSFFLNGATARGLVTAGPDGIFGSADDRLEATGETLAQIQDRVLGAGIDGAPLFTAIPGYVTFNIRARASIGERHEIMMDLENIGDRNYRGVSWGMDAPGRGVFLRYRLRF